jgi:hypothetical protein
VQCSSIRDCAASPVSSSWLGGQNGEEVKVEDEVRCEEDRSQDCEAEGRTQEGEVTPRRREGLRTGEDPIAQSARPQTERDAPWRLAGSSRRRRASAKSRLIFPAFASEPTKSRHHAPADGTVLRSRASER